MWGKLIDLFKKVHSCEEDITYCTQDEFLLVVGKGFAARVNLNPEEKEVEVNFFGSHQHHGGG